MTRLSRPFNALSGANLIKSETEEGKMMIHRRKSNEENEKKMNL